MHMDMVSPILKKVASGHLTTTPVVAMTLPDRHSERRAELSPRTIIFPYFIKGVPPHWRNSPPSVRIFVPFEKYLNDMRAMQRRVHEALERMETLPQHKKLKQISKP